MAKPTTGETTKPANGLLIDALELFIVQWARHKPDCPRAIGPLFGGGNHLRCECGLWAAIAELKRALGLES
ncbi:MAG: hypothetical protein WB780_20440 [Candidatus Acidiferrales bacterium]